MNYRLAVIDDLPQIIKMYKEIVKDMMNNSIEIWDDIYPCEFFEADIKNNQLYLLSNKDEIVSAFVLCNKNSGIENMEWKCNCDDILYLDRLGVNINYARKGIASFMLSQAKKTAKNSGAKYLRLFVVDTNKPAIDLYIKNGFTRVVGMYHEKIDENLTLHEYGYEVEL